MGLETGTETQTDFERFRTIAEAVAGKVGHAFLTGLVETLGQKIQAGFVAITQGEGTPYTHARAIFALKDNAVAQDIRYALEGTPCERVYNGETLVIPCKVADLYPKEAGFEGYIGIPLHDISDRVVGHLAVFTTSPIEQTDFAAAIIRIFAQRAEAELRRIAYEAERQSMIAELSEANTRLQDGYLKIRRESAFKTRLIGIIAHDLRSPLASVLSQAELGLARANATPPKPAGVGTALEKVIRNADRMSDLITATLERARSDEADLVLNLRRMDIGPLIRIATQANRDEAARKSIALDVTIPAPIPAEVDETLLISAIDNLISNAVKYTGFGGRVAISGTVCGPCAEIRVSDTGQGMTEVDLKNVFGRFQMLSATPTGGESSTGLGLSIVRDLATAHGGTVTADSPGKDKGSVFCLRLPLPPPATATDKPA